MTRLLLAAFLAATLGACSGDDAAAPDASPDPELVNDARAAAGALGVKLKARLVDAITNDGPVAAINVCNLEAPEIADALSAKTGMSVGRTALRWRNSDNAPDDFERAAMERFQAALADGADPSTLELAEIIDAPEGKTFRYMKPIMTDGPCVLCHGADISDEVKTAILERYPDDQATGFAPGEFRGAFTISKVLAQ